MQNSHRKLIDWIANSGSHVLSQCYLQPDIKDTSLVEAE